MSKPLRKATKIMVIRHAEKPANDGTPHGVTLEGKREKESLTARGWQRAGALANFFAPSNGRFQDRSLAEPQFLFASKPIKRKGSRRPIETIIPLAEKLAIKINSSFARFEVESMLEEAFLCRGVVLICWQREYIPQIAAHILGKKTAAPKDWPEDRFDVVWVFDRIPSSDRFRFKQVSQRLLMGDWTTPIKK
jgi:broad specificity phosphatase PhoE